MQIRSIGGDPEVWTGSTLVRKDLIPPSSLQELDIPFRYYPEREEEDPQQFLKVPKILEDHRLEELVRVTKSKILDGKGKFAQLSFGT